MARRKPSHALTGVATVVSIFLLLVCAACGGAAGAAAPSGGGSTGTAQSPTVTSISDSCAPLSIPTGQTSQCTATVQGTGNFSSAVTWSVSPSSAGTVSTTGLFTSATAGTATITATSTEDTSKSNSATVTITAPPPPPPPPPAAPTVTLSAAPTTITLGQSVTLTIATTNATSCAISGSATGVVTCNGSVLETPSPAGTASYTVTATGAGGTVSSSPLTVTVTTPPPPPPTITSVTTTCAPLSIQTGQTSQCAAVVVGTGAFSTGVTWSVSPATAGTISATGLFTSAAAGTATITAISTQDATKSGSAAVTVTTPPPPTPAPTVTITATPTSITLGQSVTLTITTSNATSCTISGSATGAVICNGSLIETPVAAGTVTYTVTATGAGGTTASTPASVTVSPVGPVITSLIPPVLHLDADANVAIQVNGSGFQTGEALTCAPVCNVTSNVIGATQLDLTLAFDAQHYSPGWIDLSVTDPAGHVSNVGKLAFVGNQNTLAMNATGELYQLDQAQGGPITHNGLVWEFRPDGTPVRSFLVGEQRNGIAADNTTGFVVVDGNVYDPATLTVLNGQAIPRNNFTAGSAVSAANGAACSLQVTLGDIACVGNLTAVPLTSVTGPAGNQPWSVSMVPFGLELDALIYARQSLTLDRISVPDMTLKGSLTLTGLTPASLLASTNGGWHVVTFGSGTAAGNAALLSAANAALSIVDLTTMTESHRIALPGAPFRIAADATHGAVIVAFADVAAGVTRYASVDVTTGTVKTLTSTSTQLSVGFGVSADGTKLYSCSRGTCEVLLNN